jgi:hypothetical protein
MRNSIRFAATAFPFLLAALTACAGHVGDSDVVDDGDGPAAVEYDPRTMVGIYYWGADYAAYDGEQDRLAWGAALMRGLGTRTVRVVMSPQDEYQVHPGAVELVDIARSQAYDALFRDSAFSTYLITTYSAGDVDSNWVDGFDDAERDAEIQEIAQLGEHLLSAYRDKTFILLNWEGDNALRSVGAGPEAVAGFGDWISARATGVREARALQPDSESQLYSGLEFNRVFDCDDTPCVIAAVAPHVAVDYYSYSSYEAINAPTAELQGTLATALDRALALVTAERPNVQRRHFLLGEMGFPREAPGFGECDVADRIGLTIAAAREWGVTYAIHWQIVDNVRHASDFFAGFGLYRADGAVTLTGKSLFGFYAGGPLIPGPQERCPVIATGGVSGGNGQGGAVLAGGVLVVQGEDLSTAELGAPGSVLHLAQPPGAVIHLRDGAPAWSESSTEMRVQLPAEIAPDADTLVWVTNGDGADSSGALFRAASAGSGTCGDGIVGPGEQCDGGPCCSLDCSIRPPGASCRDAADASCDVTEVCAGTASCPANEFRADGTSCPGGTCAAGVCVSGMCGNGVVEAGEQCDGGGCCGPDCRFVGAGVQCRAALDPLCDVSEFCSGFAALCPTDGYAAEGAACSGGACSTGECLPRIASGGIIDGIINTADISPDSLLSLYGSFSPSGNTVYMRRSGTATWHAAAAGSMDFYESATQINVQIPPAVFGGTGGTAQIYVANAAGASSPIATFTACGAAGAKCCVATTGCGTTYDGGGVYYCRNMRHDLDGDGVFEWTGFRWITAAVTEAMCDESREIGATCYECAGDIGTCQSGGYASTGTCP